MLEGEQNHSVYKLRDKEGRELTDLFEIHIIELQKELRGDSPVNDWIRLFNAKSEEELGMINVKTAGIREAVEVVRTMSLGRELKWLYEQRLKAKRDRWAEDEYVRDEGRAEGRATDILELLNECGEVPEELRVKIMTERDESSLKMMLKAAAKAQTIEEFYKKILPDK